MGEILAFRTLERNPFHLLEEMERDMNALFGTKAYDLEEKDNEYVLALDVPGIPRDKLRLEYREGLLSLSGERKGGGRTSKVEKFLRLPEGIEEGKIEAHLEDGVLTIVLPKTEKARTRRIPISTGAKGFWNRLIGREERTGEGAVVETEAQPLA